MGQHGFRWNRESTYHIRVESPPDKEGARLGYVCSPPNYWVMQEFRGLLRFIEAAKDSNWTTEAVLFDLFPDNKTEIEKWLLTVARNAILEASR